MTFLPFLFTFQLQPELSDFGPNFSTSARTFQLQSFQFLIGLSNYTYPGHGHRCGQTAGSLFSRTLESIQWLSVVGIFLTDLSGVCPVSGFCPDSLSGVCLSGFCLSRFCPVSGFCPDFQKNSVRCLSVRPDKDKTELPGLSLSLSADVWSDSSIAHQHCPIGLHDGLHRKTYLS